MFRMSICKISAVEPEEHMGSIIKRRWISEQGRPQIRWDVYVGRKGTRRQSKTFKSKASAEKWMRMAEAGIDLGSFKSTDAAERITLGQAMTRFAQEELPQFKSSAQDMSNIRTIDPHLGRYPLIAVDGPLLMQYQRKRLAMKARMVRTYRDGSQKTFLLDRSVANNTVRHEMALISRVFSCAIKVWGIHLPHGNPVRLVKLPPMGKARDRRTTDDEEQQLLDVLDPAKPSIRKRNPYMHGLVIFALETTCRRGEIVKVLWTDVDLERRTATLRDTKNGTDRSIGLSTRAVAALRSLPRTKDGRVFPLTTNAVRLAWVRALRQAGIEGLRFHDLRHEATSRLATKFNGDVMAMSAMTGHKSLQMLKRYTHIRAEELARRLG